MAFDNATRERAHVAAARRCCVCHRYKGVKAEVHHIVPEAEGDDTAENAITLCFDCHADAGHYNPRHPRGSKFSQDELRLARGTWHATVLRNSSSPPIEDDVLYCRYLVCRSFNALNEIVNGDLQNLPVPNPFLVRNDDLGFLTELIRQHPRSYRHDFEWGDSFPDKGDYSRVQPAVSVVQRSSLNTYPYFEALRTSLEESYRSASPHRIQSRRFCCVLTRHSLRSPWLSPIRNSVGSTGFRRSTG